MLGHKIDAFASLLLLQASEVLTRMHDIAIGQSDDVINWFSG